MGKWPQARFVADQSSMLLLQSREQRQLASAAAELQTGFIMSSARVESVQLAGSGSDAPSTASAWLTPLELMLLAAIWGASFLFMRVAAHDFGAFGIVEVRLFLGALVLLPLLWRARAQFNARLWVRLAGIAAIIGVAVAAIPRLAGSGRMLQFR